jgi:polysaccharide export outer membrane protein
MFSRATFRIAAVLVPWLCACSVGCQGLPGHHDSTAQDAAPMGADVAAIAGPHVEGAPSATPDSPIQTVTYTPVPPAGPAAVLGNPRIGTGSELSWSITNLPGAPGSVVNGRGRVDRDGRLDLGAYGWLIVAGLTPAEATVAIEDHVQRVSKGERPMDSPLRGIPTQNRNMMPTEGPNLVPTPPTALASKPAPVPPTAVVSKPAPTAPAQPPAKKAGNAMPMNRVEVATANQTNNSPIRPVAFRTEPPPVDNAAPAGDPLPAPRAVDHLSPIPVDPSMQPGCGGNGDGVPRELSMASLPPYILDPPDVLIVESPQGLRDQPIRGQHLIRPDGTISLGIYGSAHVAGLTLDQARIAIAQIFALRIKDFDIRNLSVDVLSYNSKVYYVITDGGGYGEQVYRVPVTGSETVLDAISQINGLPPVASKRKIWVARRTPGDGNPIQVLPVDWKGITQEGVSATNYQVLPGDRIYVKADCLMRIDAALAKFLSPIQRILGTTLLGGATVNTIASGGSSGLGSAFIAR